MGPKVLPSVRWFVVGSVHNVNNLTPRLTKIISLIDKTVKWPLLSGAPLSRWFSGKIVVIGDAAHAMLPYMSQGIHSPPFAMISDALLV